MIENCDFNEIYDLPEGQLFLDIIFKNIKLFVYTYELLNIEIVSYSGCCDDKDIIKFYRNRLNWFNNNNRGPSLCELIQDTLIYPSIVEATDINIILRPIKKIIKLVLNNMKGNIYTYIDYLDTFARRFISEHVLEKTVLYPMFSGIS